MNRAAVYATSIVLAHLLVTIGHGLAHHELGVGLSAVGSLFVKTFVLACPLVAVALVWTHRAARFGLILLSISMFVSLAFGLFHHFLAGGPDHIEAQPMNPWGTTFIVTAYALLVTEALGLYVGVHFLRRRVHHATSAEAAL